MEWPRLLAYITGRVDKELLVRNEYLATENRILRAKMGVQGEHGRVVVCGEIAPTLLSKGNAEGAIKLEHLWDEITKGYGVHTLCGYLSSAFPNKENNPIFERICAEHSTVHGAGIKGNASIT